MPSTDFEVIVIGTGVAGQTVAEELGEAGRRVAVVERREVGGTCSLRGCQPKKVLVSGVEPVERARSQAGHGPSGSFAVDWRDLMAFKHELTDPSSGHITSALEASGATILRGEARFVDGSTLAIGDERYTPAHIVVATGARPAQLRMVGEELLSTSETFLSAETLPERVVFVGGGYIAFEFAHIANAAGSRVSILHRSDEVLGGFDRDLARMLARGYGEIGIDVQVNAQVAMVRQAGGALEAVLGDGTSVPADMIVHAAGRVPDIDALQLDEGSVRWGRHGVEVDESLRSVTNPIVWAAGDSASLGLPLTPVGVNQARVIVRNILDPGSARFEPSVTPSVVFSDPPLATVGLGEVEARERGLDVEVKFSDTSQWASSRRVGDRVSGAKVVLDRERGRILGAHLLGHHAEETVNLFAAIITAGMTADEVRGSIWGYPSAASEIVYLV